MLVEKVIEYKKTQIKQWPVNSNWASAIGHECDRYLVLSRTKWQEKTLHGVDLQFRFDEGKLHEQAVLKILQESGIEVIEQRRAFSWPEYQITGKIDAKVLVENKAIPLEIKSASSFSYKSINSIEDLLNGKYPYLRKYPAQLTLYMLMSNEEQGLFIFKDKGSGQLKEILMPLDYAYGESLIQKAERVNKHFKNNTIPDPIPYDEMICGDCGFIHICLPEIKRDALEIKNDPEIELKLRRWEETKSIAKEYELLDKEIKGQFKNQEKVVIGDYFITGKPQERKAFTAKASSFWVTKISRIGGTTNGSE